MVSENFTWTIYNNPFNKLNTQNNAQFEILPILLPAGVNLALGKTVIYSTLSASLGSSDTSVIVDGDLENNPYNTHCVFTDVALNGWIAVDLGQVYSVGEVWIHGQLCG